MAAADDVRGADPGLDEGEDDAVRESDVPESIDVQPEDPGLPGRDSPEPID